ncbi:hypothetical protein HUG10_16200 [Halorarum halophilum]|uniref:Uncharacterized protein n=1 Tax=Halorarum halophilum TaxID=2743090 RepID=A0A7D5KP04_9EURY|nr:hypothetical protein [Halobaculum halophilum]QLG28982.1 hypothetical protein HUG10_16200 [Halobaculum halophilum]
MTSTEVQSDTGSETDTQPYRSQVLRRVLGTVVLLSFALVEPVVAQESAVCAAERLPEMISGFFQLTTGIGVIGVVVVWQADSLAEMFTLHPEQREGLKRHKRGALKSALLLLVLGPLYMVAGSMMNLPLAQCVDLVPW